LRIGGTVQGVGFRPFVYSLATGLDLSGFVLNDASGVVVEIEGSPESLEAFATALREPPPLATVATVEATEIEAVGSSSFEIRTSEGGAEVAAAIAPDVATCPACLAEILDPSERRHGYAFTNCTNCGPRFTITTGIPYDRANTTMAPFAMCDLCRSEYEDPRDRRFHAQPIACPNCGPMLALRERDGSPAPGDPVAEAVRRLSSGALVAIKGLGGYHIACDAWNEDAVRELRVRKVREEKPFAVMVPTLEWACRLADTSPEETAALASRRRPIVLVERREVTGLARSIAPGNRHLGLMLPYTPLHHMLMARLGSPLVLTSGNLSDEPIAHLDDDAYDRLGSVADAFLTHDRAIHTRCDDSVVRVLDGVEYPIRRARGYAPEPLLVAPPFRRPVLAAGPELKHTFCFGAGDRALLSHHIGDLESFSALQAFTQGVELWERIWRIRPEVVAHDLHPEYLSTKWALELPDVERVGVQHHHAHVAACLADAGRAERALGLALDGTGLGEDGAIWGGEVLAFDLAGYERLAHLQYVPMPGGTAAIREPWRMAAVYLHAAFGNEAWELDLELVRETRERWAPLFGMVDAGLNAPLTSSTGRLFDAVAALCGVRSRVSYEGQAAAELEQAANPADEDAYPCPVRKHEIGVVDLVSFAARALVAKRPVSEVAARFHNGLAEALVQSCVEARRETGLRTVALSGGSWQNLLLLRRVRAGLERAQFEVLVHRRVPTNDGGISFGQAVVANARMSSG
jgi:hydrogenase maturation protein HypF